MSSPSPGRPTARDALAATVFYGVVAVALTWPVFRHPATTVLEARSFYGPAAVLVQRDINLDMWTLAWDTHALLTAPLGLFHANAFYPAPYALSFAEHKLGNLPLFAPVYLATGNPVLAHQIVLLAIFVLGGLSMAAYVLYWSADRPAALVAGLLFAFAPFRLWQLGSVDYISIHLLPLVLLGVDATLDRPGERWAPLFLGAATLVSSLCSYYIAYATFVLAGTYLAVGLWARGRGALARLGPIAVALGIAAVVIGLLSVPYLRRQESGALPHYGTEGQTSLAFLGMLKFGVQGLLGWFVSPHRDGIPQFLTLTGMTLAVAAVALRRATPTAALVVVLITGVVLSLGPFALVPGIVSPIPMPYALLAWVIPGFSAMRAPQRFGALATVATMALAGLGLAWLRTWLRTRPRAEIFGEIAAMLPFVVAVAFLAEVRPPSLSARPIRVGEAIPPAYKWLAQHGDGGPLLELPLYRIDLHRESTYMYYSTYHWLPLLNGYSSYPPASWRTLADAAGALPAAPGVDAVLAAEPRWVLFHRDGVPVKDRAAWLTALEARLRKVQEFGDAVLFERR